MRSVNIFTLYLKSLKVKYTNKFAYKLYNEHPYRNTLYGLSQLLSMYKISNRAIQLKDKTQIQHFSPPFIAYASNDFVLVSGVDNNKIQYVWHEHYIETTKNDFFAIWSGILLINDSDIKPEEPNYALNSKIQLLDKFKKYFFKSVFIIGFLFLFVRAHLWDNINGLICIFLIIGLYLSYLLLQKQMNRESEHAEKLCSLFKQSDCNSVLESKFAKLYGLISWSEIGFGYFLSNIIIYLILPQWISFSILIGIIPLFYSLWSIWFQAYKARYWCPMCLIIMGIFWIVAAINISTFKLSISGYNLVDVVSVCILYIISILMTNITVEKLIDYYSKDKLSYEFNRLKFNNAVFLSLLKEERHYDVSKLTSKILFGNKDSQTLITILTNPHCQPCAKMHSRLKYLLANSNNRYCIQFIFSSFTESLYNSNKALISCYFNKEQAVVEDLYCQWFNGASVDVNLFIDNNNLIIDDLVLQEFNRHQQWIQLTQLRKTPTILINGYELPSNYKIEDLEFLDCISI